MHKDSNTNTNTGVHISEHHTQIEILKKLLRPLSIYYEDDLTEEIAICAPGILFIKLRAPDPHTKRLWKEIHDDALTHKYLINVLYAVANTYQSNWDPEVTPALYGVLPGKHRITGIAGTCIQYDEQRPEGGVSICIRQGPKDNNYQLSQWGITKDSKIGIQKSIIRPVRKNVESAYDAVFQVVNDGTPLLLSGETGTGKTSLLNLLLSELDDDLRVVTVEDTPELRVRNKNRVHLFTLRDEDQSKIGEQDKRGGISTKKIIDVITRFTPDVTLTGEISTSNAKMALEILSSGHSHFWTTIHAKNPLEAAESFYLRIRHVDKSADRMEIKQKILNKMTIIQMQQDHSTGKRLISEIRPAGPASKKELETMEND